MQTLCLTVNGKVQTAPAGTTVAGLLALMGIDPARVAIERNEDVVPRKTWTEATVAEGDKIEIVSFVGGGSDDDLVLVYLGDHQPSPVITGDNASRDVPITIVARDPAVLDRISAWSWHDGLMPGPQAPVWRMNEFRDRFLTAFGP